MIIFHKTKGVMVMSYTLTMTFAQMKKQHSVIRTTRWVS